MTSEEFDARKSQRLLQEHMYALNKEEQITATAQTEQHEEEEGGIDVVYRVHHRTDPLADDRTKYGLELRLNA